VKMVDLIAGERGNGKFSLRPLELGHVLKDLLKVESPGAQVAVTRLSKGGDRSNENPG
jgi:hypothetical protein